MAQPDPCHLTDCSFALALISAMLPPLEYRGDKGRENLSHGSGKTL
jgi:hypothetical protein